LRPDHAALVELARAAGLPATTPGSGGAVVGVIVDDDIAERAIDVLTAAGCRSMRVRLAGPTD
jgi:hypothetical protein